MTKRKSKTTLAEKISAHVEGAEPFDRFNNLMRKLVPPEPHGSAEDEREETAGRKFPPPRKK